ncbi:hypothetical protein AVEN_139745-1 [Araneus ventricosus]|uniref:Uncharacterized protein n=1 Tax=Araneus ventricosus TaxID=182803 RepID=A0A4Y2RYP1_ARAVE|nr:hypothetical protein AVEN_139745-1 [Araneus ventricosus]
MKSSLTNFHFPTILCPVLHCLRATTVADRLYFPRQALAVAPQSKSHSQSYPCQKKWRFRLVAVPHVVEWLGREGGGALWCRHVHVVGLSLAMSKEFHLYLNCAHFSPRGGTVPSRIFSWHFEGFKLSF